MDKTIDDVICPNRDKLYLDKDTYKAQIIDIELDVLDLTFNNDDCVVIDTSNYTYLTLSTDTLHTLLGLVAKAELKYNLDNKD